MFSLHACGGLVKDCQWPHSSSTKLIHRCFLVLLVSPLHSVIRLVLFYLTHKPLSSLCYIHVPGHTTMYVYTTCLHVSMRDEKEGGKKQARSKQTNKAKQHSTPKAVCTCATAECCISVSYTSSITGYLLYILQLHRQPLNLYRVLCCFALLFV